MEKTASDIESLGFEEPDVDFIVDEFVGHQGRTVTETYDYLLQELNKGNTIKSIVINIEYNVLRDTLQNDEFKFTPSDLDFIFNVYGYDPNTNKEQIIKLINDDIMRIMNRGLDKDETILNLEKVREKFDNDILDMIRKHKSASHIVQTLILLNLTHPAAAAAGIKKKKNKTKKTNKRKQPKKTKRRRRK
jgi:hypothetical protein